MPRRIVDVFDREGVFLQSYPVIVVRPDQAPAEAEYEAIALELAAADPLIATAQKPTLSVRLRRRDSDAATAGRGEALVPCGPGARALEGQMRRPVPWR
jgi:hypothetical protein